MKTSCIIPAFNEERTIRNLIKQIKKIKLIDEIIIVDDGSEDDTFKIAVSEGVNVIGHNKNRGKGAAMKTGFSRSTGEIILFLDADIQILGKSQIQKIGIMIRKIKSGSADVVIGTYDFTCFQTFTELIYRPLMSLFFPEVMSKIRTGFLSGERAIRRDVLKKIPLKNGFDVESVMNIELCFIKPKPKIDFVYLGSINPRPKGYQKSMGVIADSIVNYAKKYKRINRLEKSSFKRISKLLYDTVRKVK